MMRRTVGISWICVLLAACTPQSTEQTPAAAPSAAAVTPTPASTLAPVASLAGEWRVAGIDGASLDESYGIALSADESALWWNPRCAHQERDYAVDGLSVRFTQAPDSIGPRAGPPCLPALPARLAGVMRALDAATTIGRTANNGVEISGGGHSLLLFSQ